MTINLILTTLLTSLAALHAADASLAAPASPSATETSPAHIRIAWEPGAEIGDGYRIWRRSAEPDDQAWRLVGEVGETQTHFDDGGLDPETSYHHRVTAFNGENESHASALVVTTTPPLTPHLESVIVIPLTETFAHSPTAVADGDGSVTLAYVLNHAAHRESWRGSSIWLRTSPDGGTSWGGPHPVMQGGDKISYAKPALVRLPDGSLGMSFSAFTLDDQGTLPGVGNRARFFIRSIDQGRTWSEPSAMGEGSANNDSLTVVANSRLLQPCQLGYTKESEPLARILASDNLGATWRILSRAGARPEAAPTGESDLVHLGDGRIVLLSRHEAPFYCLNFSADNGETWDGPHTLWLGGGDNPPKIARIPGTETLVAVVHSWTDGTQKKDRRQLASVISTDGGRTWDNFRLIGFAPDGKDGFLQHSITFQGDTALIFYSDGSKGDTNQSRDLRLIRLHSDYFTSRAPWPYDWKGRALR